MSRTGEPRQQAARVRRRHHARGRLSELAAAACLVAKGYLILARRLQTPVGEIDIVAVRGNRLAFVEVKLRPGADAFQAAIGARQRQRIRRAADFWVARHPRHREREMGFDVIFVSPFRWPQHLPNAL